MSCRPFTDKPTVHIPMSWTIRPSIGLDLEPGGPKSSLDIYLFEGKEGGLYSDQTYVTLIDSPHGSCCERQNMP